MAKIDLARRAEIGRERRARTRAQIIEVGTTLLSERPLEAITVDAVVEAAGVAKGTFYYHFESIEELAAAVGERLAESFDDLLAPARLELRDPIARISFALTQFLAKAIADPSWARLVIRSFQAPNQLGRSIRANLTADLTKAMAEGRLTVHDPGAGSRHHHWYLASGHRAAPLNESPRPILYAKRSTRRFVPLARSRSRGVGKNPISFTARPVNSV